MHQFWLNNGSGRNPKVKKKSSKSDKMKTLLSKVDLGNKLYFINDMIRHTRFDFVRWFHLQIARDWRPASRYVAPQTRSPVDEFNFSEIPAWQRTEIKQEFRVPTPDPIMVFSHSTSFLCPLCKGRLGTYQAVRGHLVTHHRVPEEILMQIQNQGCCIQSKQCCMSIVEH